MSSSQCFLGSLSLGDVPKNGQHTCDIALFVFDRRFDCLDPHFLSILEVLLFNILCVPGGNNSLIVRSVFFGQRLWKEVVICLVLNLFGLDVQISSIVLIAR